VESGRSRVPVAADGSVLRGLPVDGSLPLVRMSDALPADRLRERDTLGLVRVVGAAPAALVARLEEVERESERGIVVTLEEGPELVFGSADRVRDKWIAATRVLADDASQGASYVDVRLPERPAAGGLAVETIEPGETALTYPQP
jgi:cell division protein FtsQ